MKSYCLKFKTDTDIDEIWQWFEDRQVIVLYSDEEAEGKKEIYIQLPDSVVIENWRECLPGLLSIQSQPLANIDWNEQWQLHGHHYFEGFIYIDLSRFSNSNVHQILKLQPGPGFGDLSHPTTLLVLELMSPHLIGQKVIDIGCGSGILTLASIALGAECAVAIDIETDALHHTLTNAKINQMDGKIRICFPNELELVKDPVLILINMISSEQMIAWDSVKNFFPDIKKIVSSGILKSEKTEYLALTKKWGWDFVNCREKDGWLGFEFTLR